MRVLIRVLVVVIVGMFGAGCASVSGNPTSVTGRFWQAVVDGEYAKARSLATKESREYVGIPTATSRPSLRYDNTSKEAELSVGDATVDGNKAACPTTLDHMEFMTHLVCEGGAWKVDATRTLEDLIGDAFAGYGDIQGALNQALEGMFDSFFGRTDRQAPGRGRPP